MSIANYILPNGKIAFPSEVSNNETVSSLTVSNASTTITHSVDSSGNYTIVDKNGNNLLGFDNAANLSSGCVLSSHISNNVAPVSAQVVALQTTVSAQNSLITGLTETLNNIPTDSNLTAVQTYISSLKAFFNVLSHNVVLHNQDGTNFNFTNLL